LRDWDFPAEKETAIPSAGKACVWVLPR